MMARPNEAPGCALRQISSREAIEIWRALVAGQWSILEHATIDGRRYLTARRNASAQRAGIDALSPREREVVAYAALGHTNKLIADELGIAATTVATALASAAGKLGTASRIELIRRFRESGGPPDDLVVSLSDDGEEAVFEYGLPADFTRGLSAAELAVALLVLEGKSYEEIARARGRAVRTIANQIASLFRKLGIRSRSELIAQFGDDILLR